MKKLILFLSILSFVGFSQTPSRLNLGQIQYAPGAGYVPYTDATGKQTYSLLTTVSPTIGLLPSTTSLTINGVTKTFTSPPSFKVGTVKSNTLTSGYLPVSNGSDSLKNSDIYNASGLVGIGTATPTAKLDIRGQTIAGYGNVSTNDAPFYAVRSNLGAPNYYSGWNYAFEVGGGIWGIGHDYSRNEYQFLTNGSTSSNFIWGTGNPTIPGTKMSLDMSTGKLNLTNLTASTVLYSDASKNVSSLTLGSGLSLTSGTLTATGTGSTTIVTGTNNITVTGSAPNYTVGVSSPFSNSVAVNTTSITLLNNVLSNVDQFRLSLTSGVSVTTSDVINGQAIYCTPYSGNKIGLYDGSNWGLYSSSEFSLSVSGLSTGAYDVFCYANSGVPTLEFLAWTNSTTRATALTTQDGILVKSGSTTRRYLGSFYNQGSVNSTVTISNASPCIITYTGHNLTANSPIKFTTTGTLPTGITAGTTYYLASLGTAGTNTFNISLTPGGALINTSSAGSGTHTGTVSAYVEDSEANRYLSNAYNQVSRRMFSSENTNSWNYTLGTYRQANANILNQLNFFQGLDGFISLEATTRAASTAATINVANAIGLDGISAILYTENSAFTQVANAALFQVLRTTFSNTVVLGKHYLSHLESSTASGTTTWSNGAVKACRMVGIILN